MRLWRTPMERAEKWASLLPIFDPIFDRIKKYSLALQRPQSKSNRRRYLHRLNKAELSWRRLERKLKRKYGL